MKPPDIFTEKRKNKYRLTTAIAVSQERKIGGEKALGARLPRSFAFLIYTFKADTHEGLAYSRSKTPRVYRSLFFLCYNRIFSADHVK